MILASLGYDCLKMVYRDPTSWASFFSVLLMIIFATPFGMIVYFNFAKEHEKLFTVAVFILSAAIFLLTMTVFRKADLARYLINWKQAGLLQPLFCIFLLNLPLAASTIFSYYIFQTLTGYVQKNLQQNGTLNNPQRGSFRDGQV